MIAAQTKNNLRLLPVKQQMSVLIAVSIIRILASDLS